MAHFLKIFTGGTKNKLSIVLDCEVSPTVSNDGNKLYLFERVDDEGGQIMTNMDFIVEEKT